MINNHVMRRAIGPVRVASVLYINKEHEHESLPQYL
jgi:hypothetical protein